MDKKPKFKSNAAALEHFLKEYEELGSKYGKTGDEFWLEAESSPITTEDYRKIRTIQSGINMCKHLIDKERDSE